jgi:ETC complex I subunit conserved region
MINARLIQKPKNAMQSGRAGTNQWLLEFEASDAPRADPLMGWAGSGDTRQQVKLSFPTLEAAQAYAAKKGISVTVIAPAQKMLKLQAYADNFK